MFGPKKYSPTLTSAFMPLCKQFAMDIFSFSLVAVQKHIKHGGLVYLLWLSHCISMVYIHVYVWALYGRQKTTKTEQKQNPSPLWNTWQALCCCGYHTSHCVARRGIFLLISGWTYHVCNIYIYIYIHNHTHMHIYIYVYPTCISIHTVSNHYN